MRSAASPLPILFALAVSGCAALPTADQAVAPAAEAGAPPATRPAASAVSSLRATPPKRTAARPVKLMTTPSPRPTPAAPRRTERVRAAPPAVPRPHTDETAMGGIYIYRHETFGAAVSMAVEMDGKPLGSTGAKTFLYVAAAPGRHLISTRAENADHLEIDVAAGERYYVWQAVEIGERYARTRLQLVDEPTGRAAVADCLPAAGAQLIALD